MKILIEHFITSLKSSLGIRRQNKENIIFFFKIWIIRFFFAFPKIRNFNKAKIDSRIIEKKLFQKEISVKNVLKNIIKKGYFSELILKRKNLKYIKTNIIYKNTIFALKGYKKNSKQFSKSLKPNDNLNSIIVKSKKFKISHIGLEINLNKTEIIKKLACSNFFIEIAKNYLNTNNITISGQCYISNPMKISNQEKKDNAQFYHHDLEFKKFLKVFIYLNDVDKHSGPHSFVEKSHKFKKYKHIISKRFTTNQIQKSYKLYNIKKFLGPEGKVILEDTFGLHKGDVPTNKTRAMLILIYGLGEGTKDYNFFIRPQNKNI
jgi:hypothetical protein